METHDSVNDNSLTRSGKPQSPLLKYICKACYAAPGRSMSDNILRYTDLAALIQMARSRGWPTGKIVRQMSVGLTYVETLTLPKTAAPLLDISVSEFMRLRKNG